MIGKTLGHHQKNQLGKGGMGEVFQAKDQVLGRDVAVKVFPGNGHGSIDGENFQAHGLALNF